VGEALADGIRDKEQREMEMRLRKFQHVVGVILGTVLLMGSFAAVGYGNSISKIESLAAGAAHTCLFLKDGTIWCWG
jgi:alpha-tubulin suppressor-like RCC1 family protein